MEPDFVVRQMSFRRSSARRRSYAPHREKLRWRRPWLTWSITNQEAGATFEYQGQSVRFEWQSMHERRSTPATSGGTRARSSSDWPSGAVGLTRSGLTNCTPTNSRKRSAAAAFKTLRMISTPSIPSLFRQHFAEPDEGRRKVDRPHRLSVAATCCRMQGL